MLTFVLDNHFAHSIDPFATCSVMQYSTLECIDVLAHHARGIEFVSFAGLTMATNGGCECTNEYKHYPVRSCPQLEG